MSQALYLGWWAGEFDRRPVRHDIRRRSGTPGGNLAELQEVRATVLRWVLRPAFLFAGIAAAYFAFPSRHFNADALHYNLHALYASQTGTEAFLNDVMVPGHLGWHLVAVGLIWLFGITDPLNSLLLLNMLNIAFALASVSLLVVLVRSYSDNFAASCAMLTLAFSHACAIYFLSVEVYSLNNLVLSAVLLGFYRVTSREDRNLGMGSVVALGALSVLAVLAHMANLVLLPAAFVFFLVNRGHRWRNALVYGATVTGIGAILVGCLAIAYSTAFRAAAERILDPGAHVGLSRAD